MMLLALLLALCSLFMFVLMIGLLMAEPVGATLGLAIVAAACYWAWKGTERNKRQKRGIWADMNQ